MEIEGVLDIFRLDRPTDRQPWTYRVAFIPNVSGGGSVGGRNCIGQDGVAELLRELKVHQDIIDSTLKTLREAAEARVPHLRLEPDEIKASGL